MKLKESEKRDNYLDLARELTPHQKKKKQSAEHEGDDDTNCNKCIWNNPQKNW